jgi:hypothetical protein
MILFAVCLTRHARGYACRAEEISMGRGGLDQPGRRPLYEPSPDGSADPDEEDGVGPGGLLMPDEAPPEDAPVEDDEPFELDEADVEEFLEGHDLTEEQQALLDLFLSGTGDSAAAWASLVNSLTDAYLTYVMEETDSETDSEADAG